VCVCECVCVCVCVCLRCMCVCVFFFSRAVAGSWNVGDRLALKMVVPFYLMCTMQAN
jgi:hypothetical protein